MLACCQVAHSLATNEVILFSVQNCPDCDAVKQWWEDNPGLTDGFHLKILDSEKIENFELLIKLESKLGIKGGSTLTAFCYKDTILYGTNIIPNLSELLQRAETPVTETNNEAVGLSKERVPEQGANVTTIASAEVRKKPVYLCYFFIPGCQHCSRTEIALKHLETLVPNLNVDRYDVTIPENRSRLEIVLDRLKLGGNAKSYVPLVVWTGGWISGTELSPSTFADILTHSPDFGPPFWRQIDEEQMRQASQEIGRSFQGISVLTIIFAGFLDGINPCAFATIIFLISYLALAGRTRAQMLLTGLSFGTGVFACYFLIGIGLLQALSFTQRFHWISPILYGMMAVIAVGLFVGTIRDLVILKRDGAYKMKMGLSRQMKQRIHSIIRARINASGLMIAAIVMGFLVSALELACTGQIYFPTLILINSSQRSGRSLVALLGYNVAFIVPLLIVTALAVLGVTSQAMAKFAEKHVVWTKSLMAAFFLAIAVLMVMLILFPKG